MLVEPIVARLVGVLVLVAFNQIQQGVVFVKGSQVLAEDWVERRTVVAGFVCDVMCDVEKRYA